MMKRPQDRIADRKRIAQTVNRISNRKSKCCGEKVIYVVCGGSEATSKKCSKCFSIIKYSD